MKSSTEIVRGGGWVKRQFVGKPKALTFTFLAIIWLGVSVCASIPFWGGFPASFSWLEWLCVSLIVPEPVFIVTTLVLWLVEPPRTITHWQTNPDYDIRNLH